MNQHKIPKTTLGRLPVYLQYLRELPEDHSPYISATEIARGLHIGEVQARKDLHAASGNGRPKVGYVVAELIAQLESLLELRSQNRAVLVGAGKLGKALLDYPGFETFGVEIVAGFDIDPNAGAGEQKPVYPIEELEDFCRREQIRIGILTVPEEVSQRACDHMVACGIRAIWSFTPVQVPDGVLLQHENLALSLAHLCAQQHKRAAEPPARP
ncbi:MAG: redox-sensing transcriptional repressor Rex [Oscillospiraceae bacterium]|nr:redox-sensing transcriptional repressor Rex [Oscillospiraceae bacterium]